MMKNIFKIENTAMLAPMAGFTDSSFRRICRSAGASLTVSEMVSAKALRMGDKKTPLLMQFDEAVRPYGIQLFGDDPEDIAFAARYAEENFAPDFIDINMGCPAPKIAGSGEGSALMKTPDLASDIMAAVVKAVDLPVSVKLRLGWDENSVNVVDMARRAEDAGVAEIAVHGRTRQQQYGGVADWTMIEKVKASVSVPVIGNGDIFTHEDGLRRLNETGVDGVMIARGAMGNPWIFGQLRDAIEGREVRMPSIDERIDTILRHYHMLMDWKPERIAVREMRKHIAWYLHGLRGAAQMRVKINTIETPEEAEQALREYQIACSMQES